LLNQFYPNLLRLRFRLRLKTKTVMIWIGTMLKKRSNTNPNLFPTQKRIQRWDPHTGVKLARVSLWQAQFNRRTKLITRLNTNRLITLLQSLTTTTECLVTNKLVNLRNTLMCAQAPWPTPGWKPVLRRHNSQPKSTKNLKPLQK